MRGSTLGHDTRRFPRKMPNLIARGFPPPDPDTGNFDLHAIDHCVILAMRTYSVASSCKHGMPAPSPLAGLRQCAGAVHDED